MAKLATALQSQSAADRWQAIEKLNNGKSKFVGADTISALLKALADEHPFVRWQAGLALAGRVDGSQKLVETLKNTSTATSSEISLMQVAAVDALAASESFTAHNVLIGVLRSNDACLRQSAAEALAKQKNSEAIPHLIKAIKDVDPWVRRAAAYALGHLGRKETAQILITCLQDEAVIVRRSAVYALGALRAEAAVSPLKICLADKDPLIRRNAAWALGRIGLREAIPELNKLLNDLALDGTIAATASQSIKTITRPQWLQKLWGISKRFRR